MTDRSPLELSEDLLLATKRGEPTASFLSELAALDSTELATTLDSDADKLAFWINVYNASVQCCLRDDPDRYDKRTFFGTEIVDVAGHSLTPDDIEHGILRRSASKYGFGYIPSPFPGEFERTHRVDERDWRIHFALNCGAKSCPPIAHYSADRIDDQLDSATASYLSQEVEYDPAAGRVYVPRLFLWYRGDFGGKSGILSILREFDLLPDDASPRLKHEPYDWSLALDRYAEEREPSP